MLDLITDCYEKILWLFNVSLRSPSVLKHYDVTVIVKYDCFTACPAGWVIDSGKKVMKVIRAC